MSKENTHTHTPHSQNTQHTHTLTHTHPQDDDEGELHIDCKFNGHYILKVHACPFHLLLFIFFGLFCTRAKELDWRICAFSDLCLIKIDEIVRAVRISSCIAGYEALLAKELVRSCLAASQFMSRSIGVVTWSFGTCLDPRATEFALTTQHHTTRLETRMVTQLKTDALRPQCPTHTIRTTWTLCEQLVNGKVEVHRCDTGGCVR